MEIKDSGASRDFGTGAVRDVAEGKGRCDLLPLDTIGEVWHDTILQNVGIYVRTGNKQCIKEAVGKFLDIRGWNYSSALIEVSKHYEAGANKYAERNWEKGIPLHCYIDSGIRHYLKFLRGDSDEPHDRAFVWNMLGALWTHGNKPELIDLPFKEINEND
jgi:hypothetical protein